MEQILNGVRLQFSHTNDVHMLLKYVAHILAYGIRRNPQRKENTTLILRKDPATYDIPEYESRALVSTDSSESPWELNTCRTM